MKKQFISTIRICLLFLALGSWQTNALAQTPFTITWTGLTGSTNATGVPAGITIVQQYNGVTGSCSTSSNGANTSYSAVIQAASGYTVTITSIGGSAYASNAGSRNFSFQVTNGGTYTQATPTSIGSSSNCGGNTALTAFAVPAAGQVLNSGSQATITVLRAPGSASGGGYSWTRTLTISGTVTPICNTPTNLAENNVTATSADFNWDAGGANTYEYVLDQTAATPAGAGTNLTTNSFSTSTLSPATTYYFHLRRKCSASSFSNWVYVNFTTPAASCNAPTGLAAANTTHNSADLSWDIQGSNSFEYVVDQLAADPAGAGTPTAGTTFNATGLNPSTTYYLHVRTDCGSGNFSPWTAVPFTTAIEPCDAPTGLAAANVTHNSADLSWDAQGASTYEYVVDQVSTDPASGTSTTGTSFNPTGLNSSTTYYLHVRTNCVQGNTSAWTTISFTTAIEPCDAPTGLTAANVTHNSADLSWDAQGASTYEYVVDQISTDPASGTLTVGTTYNAAGLNQLTTYYLHVRTNCVQGNTSGWTTISFTTTITPCIAPTGLAAANVTHNSANLSWNAQGSNTFEYVLDQTASDPLILGIPTTLTTYNPTTLSPSTTYYLHVRTDCSGANFSPWTTISFTTTIAPCDAPTGLTASNISQNTAELSWNTQAGSTYEYAVDQVSTDPASGTAITDTFYNASGLNAATTYYLHVRTHCAQGNTSGWTTIPFTTLPEPCDAPTGLTIANTTQNTSDLSWNVQGGNSFEYVLNQTASNPASGTATTANSYSASGLNASTTYYFHVRTNCGNGNFSDWTTVSFTTDDAPCIAPAGLTVSNITSSSANLNWTAQAGNTFQYVLNQTSTNPNAGGTATSNNTFAAATLNSSSTYFFHVRTDCGNGNFSDWSTVSFTTASTVGLNEQEIISLSVYPNPANDLVTITGQTEGTATLITVNGQVLTTIDLEKQNKLDLSGYESGVYFIKYVSEKGTANVTVIKE